MAMELSYFLIKVANWQILLLFRVQVFLQV